MTIRIRDRGFAKVVKSLLGAGETTIAVGIHGDEGGEAHEGDEETTVGEVAEANEFGLGRPQRSFVRGYADEKEQEINDEVRNLAQGVAKGKINRQQFVDQFGSYLVGGMQERISAGIPPDNADSTIKRKGSSTPLIDTGQLRSSIRYKEKGK